MLSPFIFSIIHSFINESPDIFIISAVCKEWRMNMEEKKLQYLLLQLKSFDYFNDFEFNTSINYKNLLKSNSSYKTPHSITPFISYLIERLSKTLKLFKNSSIDNYLISRRCYQIKLELNPLFADYPLKLINNRADEIVWNRIQPFHSVDKGEFLKILKPHLQNSPLPSILNSFALDVRDYYKHNHDFKRETVLKFLSLFLDSLSFNDDGNEGLVKIEYYLLLLNLFGPINQWLDEIYILINCPLFAFSGMTDVKDLKNYYFTHLTTDERRNDVYYTIRFSATHPTMLTLSYFDTITLHVFNVRKENPKQTLLDFLWSRLGSFHYPNIRPISQFHLNEGKMNHLDQGYKIKGFFIN